MLAVVAARIDRDDPLAALELREVPEPQPPEGWEVVEVRAASLNYHDLWTLMGVPCVNIPAHVTEAGLPVGGQVIARYGNDAGALAAARFVEEALARR